MLGVSRESSKLVLRRSLLRADLGLTRDPAVKRLVRTLRHLHIDMVLDVGANQGQFAALVRAAGYDGRIVSFEPLPDAHRRLEKRADRDRLWSTSHAALGATNGSATIHVSANSYSSSILEMTRTHLAAAPQSRVITQVEAPLRRLDGVCSELGIEPGRTLLKVDTQGYESEVLDGAGDLLSALAAVQLELSFVELYRGQALFDDLRTRLQEEGLVLWSLEPGISDESGRLLQCDAVFARPRPEAAG